MRAFVFPGQGAQVVGMGRALAEAYPSSRAVFEETDEALGERLSSVIWGDDADTLQLTRNAQPALMATSIAALRALEVEGVPPTAVAYLAGHSLGEYAALCAAGALSLADTARLLRVRGDAMQDAVPVGEGAMAALLGIDFAVASEVAREAAKGGGVCEAANDNDPLQVVVSGTREAVERAVAMAKDFGARRAVMLPVSAPFHSTLMAPAAAAMEEALARVALRRPFSPVVANVTAQPVQDPAEIRRLLVRQVTDSVRWRESVLWMAGAGVTEAWELGSGKQLSAMIRRTAPAIATHTVGTPQEATEVAASLLAAA